MAYVVAAHPQTQAATDNRAQQDAKDVIGHVIEGDAILIAKMFSPFQSL